MLAVLFSSLITLAAFPTAVMHGLGDTSEGIFAFGERYAQFIKDKTGESIYFRAIEVGDGALDSYMMPFLEQVALFAEAVRSDPKFQDGFDLVCYSQGGLVCRGYVELYNDPPVRNLMTVVTPIAGEFCGIHDSCPFIGHNPILVKLLSNFIYADCVQDHFAISNYWRDPFQMSTYKEKCAYLPLLDNEHDYDEQRKERIESLNKWILVATKSDDIVKPWGSCIGDFYHEGDDSVVETLEQRKVYTENLYGMRTLNEDGRLIRITHDTFRHVDFEFSGNNQWMCDNVFKYMLD